MSKHRSFLQFWHPNSHFLVENNNKLECLSYVTVLIHPGMKPTWHIYNSMLYLISVDSHTAVGLVTWIPWTIRSAYNMKQGAHYIWLHLSRLGSRGWVLAQPQFFGLELRAPMGNCPGQYSISVRYASRKFLRGYTLHNFPFVPDWANEEQEANFSGKLYSTCLMSCKA